MTKSSAHIVVDGSNIATEGRTVPSLQQLDEAVRAVLDEQQPKQITVVVDATFAHRVEPDERAAFEEALENNELLTPPAGVVGRGDAFILQIAERANATVLSNDSFQEFHGEHPWLFDDGRLMGGKPVEGVGWIFVDRVPVRGPKSRQATSASSKTTRKKTTKPTSRASKKSTKKTPRKSSKETEKNKSLHPDGTRPRVGDSKSTRKPTSSTKSSLRLNDPAVFLGFVNQYSVGDQVQATVEQFSSHGCYLLASSAKCYLPLSAMSNPAPLKARDMVAMGQGMTVRVESIDPDRLGVNVSLVRLAKIKNDQDLSSRVGALNQGPPQVAAKEISSGDDRDKEANLTRSEIDVATKQTAKKTKKKATAKAAPKKAAKATSSSKVKKAAPKKATERATKKVAKRAVKKAPAKKAVKKTAKRATAKKAPTKKGANKAAVKKAAKKTAKKSGVKKATKKAAKKAPTKKTAKKAVKKTAKRATAKKAPTKKVRR